MLDGDNFAVRSGGEDGAPSPFNDHGEVVFQASWEDLSSGGGFSSGVFTAADPGALLTFTHWSETIHRLQGDDATAEADPDGDGGLPALLGSPVRADLRARRSGLVE